MKLPDVAPDNGTEDTNTTHFEQGHTAPFRADLELPLVQPTTDYFIPAGGAPETLIPKKKRSLKGLGIFFGVLIALVIAAYVGLSVYFMDHFAFNTTVNGINVAFKTAEEVDAHLATEMSSYKMQLEGRGQNAVVNGSEIDLAYVSDGQIDKLLTNQNEWLWPLMLFPHNEASMQHVSVEYDEKKLESVLSALPMMDPEQMTEPVDAHLAFENGAYVISPGDVGTTLDTEKAIKKIKEAITDGETELDLDEAGLYLAPEIGADDPTLVSDRDTFNTYVPFQIVYTLGDNTEVLDGHTTINWVNTEGEPPYTLDEEAVWAWVADFASRYDTYGTTRTIVNGYGEEKLVSGGTYGWRVDQESEFWAIITAAEQHLGENREPYLLGTAASLSAPEWGTTYLEVDLTAQHMWYFVDGEVVLETDVVTGNPNTGYATPEGVWSIFIIDLDVITRGDPKPDGTFTWGPTPVDYWMQFTSNGCGFHDAPWQSSFGGDRYLITGSHGCINMPPDKAAELYEIVEMGTPVITHY